LRRLYGRRVAVPVLSQLRRIPQALELHTLEGKLLPWDTSLSQERAVSEVKLALEELIWQGQLEELALWGGQQSLVLLQHKQRKERN
jgi:hypothetical protein